MPSNPLGHEFDSSQTCNYCGIAEEKVPKGFYRGEQQTCPVRLEQAKKEQAACKQPILRASIHIKVSVIGEQTEPGISDADFEQGVLDQCSRITRQEIARVRKEWSSGQGK